MYTLTSGIKAADSIENTFNKICKLFGVKKLNNHLEDSSKCFVEKKNDIFVNFPTGFGKSLIYEALLVPQDRTIHLHPVVEIENL